MTEFTTKKEKYVYIKIDQFKKSIIQTYNSLSHCSPKEILWHNYKLKMRFISVKQTIQEDIKY